MSAQLLPLTCYTGVGVLCEQSEMLIKIYNSHFSHYFLLAALLLSVALSSEGWIRPAAELMQQSWRLRASTVNVTVRLQLCVYIKCVRFGWIDVEFVAYHLRTKARAVSVAFVVLPLLSAKLT